MRVLKIVAEGIKTSFRYPHFMQQIQPTYHMPPPATIYGHIASALGYWFDPADVQFAYHFSHKGIVSDLEHVIVATAATGKLKGTDIPKVLEGSINPFSRELLFEPKLTLYINQPEWEQAFKSPRYTVVLGRSQDLFTYTNIQIIELEQAERAYFEHTLLPHDASNRTHRGYAIVMPRFLDFMHGRHPTFASYFIIDQRVDSKDFLWFDHNKVGEKYWIDPTSPEINGAHLGLSFLNFVDQHETNAMA